VSIATKAVRGAGWNLVAGVGSRVVALVGTLVLTRFIAPAEYGEISAASITILTAMMLTDASVGQAILARRVGPDVCFHAFVLHMAGGVLGLVPVFLLAGPLASWLDAPGMARFLPGFAVAALIERFSHVPGRVLVRDLRFRTVALTRGTAEIVFTAVCLGLAPSIQGYAIVAGNLVRFTLIAGAFLSRVERREWFVPQRLRWSVLRDLLGFGLPLSAGAVADFASSNWDNLLVARFFGTSTMGAYRLSRNLAETPITNFAEHIGEVLLPSFAQMDLERRRSALVRAASMIALLVFPLCVGLAAIAPTLVRALFDARWADIAPFLSILAASAIARPMSWAVSSFLQAQQHSRALMLIGFLKLAATLGLVLMLGPLGPSWACAGVGLAGVVALAANVTVAHRDGVSAPRFLGGMSRAVAACAPMFFAVALVRRALDGLGAGGTVTSLAAEIAVGAVAYVAAALVVARPIVNDLTGLLRQAMARRASRAAPTTETSA
jgi:PST family polysaccharide transporter